MLEEKIKELFFDNWNRPKKIPIHEAAIQIQLEEEFPFWRVNYGLEKLVKNGTLTSVRFSIPEKREARFFFPKVLLENSNRDLMDKKMKRAGYWINRYSNKMVTNMLGKHLQALVKGELRAQGFEIKEHKNLRGYDEVVLDNVEESLDLIALKKRKNLKLGLEIKNMLPMITKDEIVTKIDMCKRLRLTPVFACRWIEPYRKDIEKSGGFVWQFKYQLYPLGQKKFVETIRKRFKFPIQIASELPEKAVKDFEKWFKTI